MKKVEVDERNIIVAIKSGCFLISPHAIQRMLERNILEADIVSVAKTYFQYDWHEDKKTHRFIGFMTNGDRGGFVAVCRDQTIVITVFDRRKGR